jgi:hypothetical protein
MSLKNTVHTLFFLVIAACATTDRNVQSMERCLAMQVEQYGDICRESQQNFEGMDAFDAHFEGVKCAVESVRICLDAEGL